MTKLRYRGRMNWVDEMDQDGRLWDIVYTLDSNVKPFINSTRMLEGLKELGIIKC